MFDGFADAGILHLHGHTRAILEPRAMHLADGGSGERLAFEVAGRLAAGSGRTHAENLFDEAIGHRRGVRLQGRELRGHLIGQDADHEGEHLPDLHDGALHVAHGARHVLGSAHDDALAQGLAPLAPDQIRARPAHRGGTCHAGGPPRPFDSTTTNGELVSQAGGHPEELSPLQCAMWSFSRGAALHVM